jgi:hypothetical protein
MKRNINLGICTVITLLVLAIFTPHTLLVWSVEWLKPFIVLSFFVFWFVIIYPRRGFVIDTEHEISVLIAMILLFGGGFNFFILTRFEVLLGSVFTGILFSIFYGISIHLNSESAVWEKRFLK